MPDALVLIDRVGVGTAPITVTDLSPGLHTVNVSATGYDGFSETVTLAPGVRTIVVSFKEIRLDAKLAAVHKHSLGSCRGQLAASPEGLQYVADDGKDRLAVAFEDVAVFEMDYLAPPAVDGW